jgi:hypothetical protein
MGDFHEPYGAIFREFDKLGPLFLRFFVGYLPFSAS